MSCFLHRHMLVISGDYSTNKNIITIGYYCFPTEYSKFKSKHQKVVINSNYDMSCTLSSTDKETNKICTNPAKMMGEKKLLILKHERLYLLFSFARS